MTPLASILLCTFQGEKYLQQQLDSLLTQSYQNFNIYIFDDASTDNTVRIVKKYLSLHTNIYLNINKQQLGFVRNFEHAINMCLNQEKCHYFALCDQDDIWHKDKLFLSMRAMRILEINHPQKAALVHCNLRVVNDKLQEIAPSFFDYKNISLPSNTSVNKVLGYNGIMGNTLLINRHLAKACLPFPKPLKYHDYWISLVNELFGVRTTLAQTLIDYRIHQNNISNNKNITRKSKNWRFVSFSQLPPPFLSDKREYTMQHLLTHYPDLKDDDRLLLIQYQRYLTADMGRIEALHFLFFKQFLKNGWKHKLSVFFRVLIYYPSFFKKKATTDK